MKNYVLQIKNTAIVSCVNPVFIMKIHKPIIAVVDFFYQLQWALLSAQKREETFYS